VGFEWDAEKAEANFAKHGVRFTESLSVFDDDLAITVPDDASNPIERRFVSIGTGAKGRVLVVVYSWRRTNIRIISARRAETHERAECEEKR
jgi:uncharacterized DUF497 family protein